MSMQNIGAANSDDAFYRYKMPKMITKIEGRGNGIKTNIVNMVDIAKALARDASYTTKYFGCELGAQSKFDVKTGVSLVNGSHDTQKLAGLLEVFIKKYVQCYGCGNPETEIIIISKTQCINLKCAACGFLSEVNMRDKITSFILKNPPELKKGSKDKKAMRRAEKERLKEGEVADEEQKKVKKAVKKGPANAKTSTASKTTVAKKKCSSSEDEDNSPLPIGKADDEDDDSVQWQTDTSLEAARQRVQEQLSAATADMVMLSTNEPENQEEDAKKTDKKKEKSDKTVKTSVNGGDLGTLKNLVEEIKKKLLTGSKPTKIVSFLVSLSGTPQQKMTAFFEALFDGVTKGFAKELEKKKNYLAAAVAQDEKSQILVLHALEAFCINSGPDVVKEVGLVSKILYDNDVLDEECILQWYNAGVVAGGNKNVVIWMKMKPFIEWLRSAESESEDD